MYIGVPKEIKNNENRVALSPYGVRELILNQHKVFIEKNAGKNIGFADESYLAVGAKICNTAAEIFEKSDLIMKVKEPQSSEIDFFKQDQILFSYLHLAAEENLTRELLKKDMLAISYETITANNNSLPLLIPMSEVAGRISIQSGAFALQKNNGGKGILLGGVPGVEPAHVTIIGGGVAGYNAALMAVGMGADVTILDKSLSRIRELNDLFKNSAKVIYATSDAIEENVVKSDLVIGAVLIPGAKAPKVVSRELISRMAPGSVIVDISIDQGGCIATSKPTTHSNPTYEVDGIIHYCVTNMPAAAARTATRALENATLPYILELANKGYKKTFQDNAGFLNGINIYHDKVTLESVASQFSLDYLAAKQIIA